jgi:hypothetical protein
MFTVTKELGTPRVARGIARKSLVPPKTPESIGVR